MKTKMQFFMIVGLIVLILGIPWLSYSMRDQEPAQIFPATIYRDCAPWDGAAFTVFISMTDGAVMHISIWQAPKLRFPVTFTFPDETGQIGFAYILPYLDPNKRQIGEVSFWRVEEGLPVEGEFNFKKEDGERINGRFKAEWGDQVVYCG